MADLAIYPETRLYRIQDCRPRFLRAGRDPLGRQFLLLPGGLSDDPAVDAISLQFNPEGHLVLDSTISLGAPPREQPASGGPRLKAFQSWLDAGLQHLMVRGNFEPATIAVRRFWLPDRHMGIESTPRHFAWGLECEENRRKLELSRQELEEEIACWRESGLFVLWLRKHLEYWLNADGSVNST